MCNEKILSELKLKCEEFLRIYNSQQDTKKIEIYSSIKQILNTENVFEKLDAEVALNILYDLVQSKTKAKALYVKILSNKLN